MIRHISYILFSCLLTSSILAQTTDSLVNLEAQGPIPKEFITPSTSKYKRQIEKMDDEKLSRRTKKNQKQFILQSNFIVDDLMQSGLVLFNDPITTYLNQVLAELVKTNTKLRSKKPRVYALRSSNVNAFATDQGLIFVTLGLLANLENEAQLAYILAHELVHVKERHTLDMFLEAKDIEKGNKKQKKVLSESSFDRQLLAKSLYSKKIEQEADDHGLEYYRNTNYSLEILPTVFDVLFYAYLPFNDVPFDKQFLVNGDYELPAGLWLKEVQPITGLGDQKEDKYSTHPSAYSRQKKLVKKLEGKNDKEGTDLFLVSEDAFQATRKQARFELPNLYLEQENFGYAIYTSYLLLQERPTDTQLKKVIAKALYMSAKYKNSSEYVWPKKHKDIEGASQMVFHLLDEIKAKEMTILALQYAWRLHEEIPLDKELQTISKDLCMELVYHEEGLNAFLNKKKVQAPVKKEEQSTDKTKYENIRAAQTKDSVAYWAYAFGGFLDDPSFKKTFDESYEDYQEQQKRMEYYGTKEGRKEQAKKRKREEKQGRRLGISRVAIVNPFYMSIDARKENSVQYIRSEKGQDNYRKMIKEVAEVSKLKTTILDVTNLKKSDADKFNDIRHLNSWFAQQIDHYDLSLTPGYNQNRIDEIADKYKTDYFLWTGTISLRQKKNPWGLIAVSLLVPYVLPFSIGAALVPEYDMLFYAILYDVKTGRRSVIKMDYFDAKDSKAIVRAHLYDAFQQIREK